MATDIAMRTKPRCRVRICYIQRQNGVKPLAGRSKTLIANRFLQSRLCKLPLTFTTDSEPRPQEAVAGLFQRPVRSDPYGLGSTQSRIGRSALSLTSQDQQRDSSRAQTNRDPLG